MKNKKLLAALLIASISLTACVKNGEDAQTETNTDSSQEQASQGESLVDKEHSIKDEPRYGSKIRIGFDGDLCIAGQNIAEIEGYYKEKDLDVEFVNIKQGKDALGTGQIDVMTGEFGGLLVPATKGLNYVFSTSNHSGCKSLYVLDESSYKETKDLENEAVAVTNGIGNSGHNTLLRFLSHDGIDSNKINVKPVDPAAVIQALESGEIKGAVLDDQFAQEFLQAGKIRPIRSLTTDEDFKDEVCCVTAFNRDFVDQNPMIAELVAEQIVRGSHYVADNPEEALKKLQDNNLAAGDPEVATELLKTYDYSLDNEAGLETIRAYFDDYKKLGLIDDSKSTDDYIKEYWRPLGNGEVEVVE
ncbi:ABC transporter substrate-binding protein [Anaerococcus sp.]|uniref:ABC transporter substrate-binding protein n=1 Tax=Anaerococcus sp. TaxID=1872515 RepID=UPI0027BB09E7|nr:ABC transporter substrate-binding protein [Anaerococcus sp.]